MEAPDLSLMAHLNSSMQQVCVSPPYAPASCRTSAKSVVPVEQKALLRIAVACFIDMYWLKTVFLYSRIPFTEVAEIVVEFPCQLENFPFFFLFFTHSLDSLASFGAKYTKMENDEYLSVK